MNAAHDPNELPPSHVRLIGVSKTTEIGVQAAIVRSLLDEVERAARSGRAEAVSQQLVEELARLGCRCIEIASTLTSSVRGGREVVPSELAAAG